MPSTDSKLVFTMKSSIVALLVIVTYVQCAKFPSNFKKCDKSDPEWKKCVFEAAKEGIKQLTKPYPQINLANFSPMEITELNIGAGSQGVVNVDQKFKNCKLYGIQDVNFENFELNLEDKYISGAGSLPEIKLDCHYELNGKVLLLPIVGSGPSTIILKDVKVKAHFNYEEVKKKDKTFMHFTSQKFELDPAFISFNFENLFNGDKQLGDNINKVLNENYKEVFADVKSGYEDGLGKILQQILNNLFSKVSIEEATS